MVHLLSEFKNNIKIAYPIMLAQLAHVLMSVVDNLMVGKLGVNNLAAVSLGNAIFFMIFVFGLGISTAITPLVATAEGKSNKKQSTIIFEHGFILNIAMGALMTIVTIVCSPLMDFLNQPKEVTVLAIPYLNTLSISFIPLMLFQALRQFSEGLSLTKPPMYASYIANVINVILNYILIFGYLGFEKMGIKGAAYSTLISRICMFIFLLIIILKSPKLKIYISFLVFKKFKKKIFLKIFNLGIPNSLQMMFEVGAFAASSFISGTISANALAAHQIAVNLSSISFLIIVGIGTTATIRVANQKGFRNLKMVKTVGFSCLLMVFIIMIGFGIVFLTMRDILPQIYIQDQNVIKLTSSLLFIVALFQISDGIQIVSLGILRGLQDIKIPTIVSFIAYWVISLPVAYILAIPLEYGVIGVWAGLGIGLSISAILLTIRFYKLKTI